MRTHLAAARGCPAQLLPPSLAGLGLRHSTLTWLQLGGVPHSCCPVAQGAEMVTVRSVDRLMGVELPTGRTTSMKVSLRVRGSRGGHASQGTVLPTSRSTSMKVSLGRGRKWRQ